MHAEDLDPIASPPRTLQAMTYSCRIFVPPAVREGFSHCLGESLFHPRERLRQRWGAKELVLLTVQLSGSHYPLGCGPAHPQVNQNQRVTEQCKDPMAPARK